MRPEALGRRRALSPAPESSAPTPDGSSNPLLAKCFLPPDRQHARKMEYSRKPPRQLVSRRWGAPPPRPAVRERLPVSTRTDTTVPPSGIRGVHSIRLLGCAHRARRGSRHGFASGISLDVWRRRRSVVRSGTAWGWLKSNPTRLTLASTLGSFAFRFRIFNASIRDRETLPRARSPRRCSLHHGLPSSSGAIRTGGCRCLLLRPTATHLDTLKMASRDSSSRPPTLAVVVDKRRRRGGGGCRGGGIFLV